MPVFDQGYQHWSGTLSGHAWRWWTITRHGVRVGAKNPFLRILIIASWTPALALAAMLCLWGLLERKSGLITSLRPMLASIFPPEMLIDPRHFRVEVWTLCYYYFLQIELFLSMILVLQVGPNLISQDLRFNALPLYFSRPLRRGDYFLGKLGVIAWFLGLVVILPSLIAYVLGLLFSLDPATVWDTFPLLLACLGYGAVIVLSAGTLMLALSSLSRNSRYIALFWVALWLVSSIVAAILEDVDREQRLVQAGISHHYSTPAELQEAELQAVQTNWRPLVSYTANLSRIGERLLNSNAAWRKVSGVLPAELRNSFLLKTLGPQYPWYWSAGVLAALFGLSACILNYRVRSLDRLK